MPDLKKSINPRILQMQQDYQTNALQHPDVVDAIARGYTGEVQAGPWKVHMKDGETFKGAKGSLWKPLGAAAGVAAGGIGAGMALGAGGGAALSAPSSVLPNASGGILAPSSGTLAASSTVPNLGTLAGTTLEGGSKMFGGLGSILGKMKSLGLDPMTLGLGAMSLFGGDDGGDQRTSFKGTSADPVRTLTEALAATKALGQERRMAGPFRQRRAPEPINAGPVQIGGGFGMDPALAAQMGEQGNMSPVEMQRFDPSEGQPKKAVQRRKQ